MVIEGVAFHRTASFVEEQAVRVVETKMHKPKKVVLKMIGFMIPLVHG